MVRFLNHLSAFETLGRNLEKGCHLGQARRCEGCPKAKVSPERPSSGVENRTEQGHASSGIARGTVGSCCISCGPEVFKSRSSRLVGAAGPRTKLNSAVLCAHCRWSSSGVRCLFSIQKISFSICIAFKTVEKLDEVSMVVFAARIEDC